MRKRAKRIFIAFVLFCAPFAVFAQPHNHPPQDVEIHEKFYSSWNRPDYRDGQGNRMASCCNKQDCYPTSIKRIGGSYYYERREDRMWLPIPEGLLEHNQTDPRESPDGRSHICAQPPRMADMVYCAALGNGM